ncbi:serine protease, S1-C subfamily, contains C-terminal PDZ domain [Kaistia soli DSM 19436]|uniref:Serine protease, S1-C subfamily, contains C-terminal PDZ domain n=1 Tax=Kaistia soli DSM 19436 TaxID=1122133 RepID=A0A1M5IK63_9HYPH|nr:S1C family serine protease [Kaistia soli]SHG28635.1 serine protease, S1-C subfamily, contains C-terminal PDZ domain [Kaistia soli DSM 19436]
MDLAQTLKSIVAIHALVPDDAFTAGALGTERAGSGVVIRDGLVLTIGYLITEADRIWLRSSDGRLTPGHALAYDQDTGFGLVQALGRLDLPALELGSAAHAEIGDPVVVAGGEAGQYVRAQIVAKQTFAGYWEYLLDEALFTAPAHPLWGGAGVIDADGRLIGIGSLLVQQMDEDGEARDANMVVPIDLLPPILDDLLAYGQVRRPPRPWLGMFSAEHEGGIVVVSLADDGPAAQAGVRPGDIVTGIGGRSVERLADLYRALWASGPAGTDVEFNLVRDDRPLTIRIKSANRADFLKKPRLH